MGEWFLLQRGMLKHQRQILLSVVDLSVYVIGDVFCPTPEKSIVGTQKKPGSLRRNTNQEYAYNCWRWPAVF